MLTAKATREAARTSQLWQDDMGQDDGWRHRIAVGTALSGRPPHRSVREELPHTAPTSSRTYFRVVLDGAGRSVDVGLLVRTAARRAPKG